MARLDIDQKRALAALGSVKKVKKDNLKEYGSYVESLPMMIHNSGLRNTLSFALLKGYKGKSKSKAWEHVFSDLLKWLGSEPMAFLNLDFRKKAIKETLNEKEAEELLELVLNWGNEEYRFATQETFAFVNWLRKLAKNND